MLDWRFYDYETLPLLVTLLVDASTSRSEATLDELYNTNPIDLAATLLQTESNSALFEEIQIAVIEKQLQSETTQLRTVKDPKSLSEIKLEPSSFFRWAENLGFGLPYNVRRNVEEKEEQIRIAHYSEYKISKSEVEKKMNEPLWEIYHAILYLHGFEPATKKKLFGERDPNFSIVNSQPNLKAIGTFLNDANKVGSIKIYSGNSFGSNKVRPSDFMEWASTLGIDFPNLISVKAPEQAEFHSKEKQTLLKLLLGLALTNYEYNPKASRNSTAKEISSDLALHGLQIDEDTVRKWLNESKELLPQDWKPD